MKGSTIRFTRTGQEAKYIPNVVNHKGFLCGITEIGVGTPITKGGFNSYGEGETWEEYKSYKEHYKPYFDSEKMNDAEKLFCKTIAQTDARNIIGTDNEKFLMKFETNEHYSCIDIEEEKRQQQADEISKIASKESPIIISFRAYGYFVESRLPLDLFDKIKVLGTYWSANDIDEWNDDMDDFSKVGDGKYMKGWYYSENIISELEELGYQIVRKWK